MGEIAEMMLEGGMCQWCGDLIGDGDGAGFPTICAGCQGQHGVNAFGEKRGAKRQKKFQCSCGRGFDQEQPMAQHRQAKRCR